MCVYMYMYMYMYVCMHVSMDIAIKSWYSDNLNVYDQWPKCLTEGHKHYNLAQGVGTL
jgi:hypothetical protein